MIGSKYNYETKQYDYYRIPNEVGDITTPPYGHRQLKGNGSKTGFVPEQLAAALPSNAEKIGSGKAPQGIMLGSFNDLVGASDEAVVALGTIGLAINLAVLGFAAYGAYTWWNKR
jgi:hypothetical protein